MLVPTRKYVQNASAVQDGMRTDGYFTLEEFVMGMVKEFKEFAVRGNVVDMAVGIIIGAAFGKIVSSFVGDVIMPPIGVLLGGVNFSNLAFTLKEAAGDMPAVVIGYGKFIQTVIDFVIIAFAIFVAIKGINKLKRKEEEEAPKAPAVPPAQEVLLTEIRDLLKERK
jgi:large conductance mechanosensitive channel